MVVWDMYVDQPIEDQLQIPGDAVLLLVPVKEVRTFCTDNSKEICPHPSLPLVPSTRGNAA